MVLHETSWEFLNMAGQNINESDPEFVKRPWSRVEIDYVSYAYKFYAGFDFYSMVICDGLNAWHENLSKDEIENKHQELNPSIEAPFEIVFTRLKQLFISELKSVSLKKIYQDDEKFILETESNLKDLPFMWDFNLVTCPKEMFAQHLTFPLIAMVLEQENRIKELCKIIAKKDAEIEDYKLSGASNARKPTLMFNSEDFFDPVYSKLDQLTKNTPIEFLCIDEKVNNLYQKMNDFYQMKARKLISRNKRLEKVAIITQSDESTTKIKQKANKVIDNQEIENQRRIELKKRLDEQEKLKEAKKRRKKIVKL